MCEGTSLGTKAKQSLVMNLMVIISLLSGIALGTVVTDALEDHSQHSGWSHFEPHFTILGVVYAVLLVAHDVLLMHPKVAPKKIQFCDEMKMNMD